MSILNPPSCEIRIGTSGYAYHDWEGVLYPKGCDPSNYLMYYSEHFSTIELKMGLQSCIKYRDMKKLLAESRQTLDFAIRVGLPTNVVSYATYTNDIFEIIRGTLAPIAEVNRLYSLLLSFPDSFHYGIEERKFLSKLISNFFMFPVAVEFNNNEWNSFRVIEGLRERQISLSLHATPMAEKKTLSFDLITSPRAYIRFRDISDSLGDEAKQGYCYSADELTTWCNCIETISTQARALRVLFDYHRNSQSIKNAAYLIKLCKKGNLF